MMISVIVPAFNACKTIRACLDSLCGQTLGPERYEILLVDDGSTDDTPEIVAGYDRVRLISQENAGPAAARNHGAAEAAGELLVFTDSDCRAAADWLETLTAPLREHPEIAAAKGAYRTRQQPIIARFVQLEYEDKYDVMKRSRYIDFVDTYSAAFRRTVFLDSGGYDEDFPVACAEDVELSFRLAGQGHKMVFVPEAVVYHRHPDSLWDYLKKKFKFARWRVLAVRKNASKIVKDSHTPQSMKLQLLLVPVMLVGLILWSAWIAVPAAALFVLLGIPFIIKALVKDPLVGLLSPVLLLGRSAAQFLGVAVGVLSDAGRRG